MNNAESKLDKQHELIRLCRDLFAAQVIATDFDDVQVLPVTPREFIRQPSGDGLNISFSVSWHAIGKTGKDAHDAIGAFAPIDGWNVPE